ncbi:MAG TPA: chloroperoxidase [Verrucomicrobiae bacterium]|nr:chloroperoxidase [Verrucomicrobiae bacterium]
MKSSSCHKCIVPNGARPQPGAATFNRRSFVKRALAVTAAAACLCGGRVSVSAEGPDSFGDAFGPLYQGASPMPASPRHGPRQGLDSVRRWNQIAIDASGLDHTPVAPGENRVFGEQIGPCRASRALAIVHIAMFDTLNAVVQEYESYTGVRAPHDALSLPAAISQAAHDTLAALFPSQADSFDARLAEDLGAIKNKMAKINGIALGRRAAAAILALKANDGSQHAEPRVNIEHVTSDLPGHWRQDPISQIPLALGAKWGACIPFSLASPDQFRVPPPPAMDSPEYAAAYNEVKRVGGDGVVTPTERTPEQTLIGIYWAYDGTPSLCAPPRLYNQIALQIADHMGSDDVEVARLLALVNVAMADAGIAIWESKYYYDFWRPVTGIRESDPGTGPTGAGDGNPATIGDPIFSPLGAPASNLQGPNFTPPFPAYPSGHAGFGGALFQTLRRFYGTDDIAFTFVSDELNGVTLDNNRNVRPLIPRSFSSLSEAEEENAQSRIYLGIHWSFDKRSITQGNHVADYVFEHTFTPLQQDGR